MEIIKKHWYLFFIAIALIIIIVISLNPKDTNYKKITEQDLETLSNITLIDVRTKEEYETGHIKDAINIPYENIESLDKDKEKTIVVYCQSGNRSKKAATTLIKEGYKTVYDLGGLNNITQDLVKENNNA